MKCATNIDMINNVQDDWEEKGLSQTRKEWDFTKIGTGETGKSKTGEKEKATDNLSAIAAKAE